MEVRRDRYLEKLIRKKWNGSVKIITGIRRCGKSYLLFKLFYDHLIESGIDPDDVIRIALDDRKNISLRDPDALYNYVSEMVKPDHRYYLMIDEIQLVPDFVDTINGFRHMENVDIYVTGSNSRMLAKDVVTDFRGRGDNLLMFPLSFSEFLESFDGSPSDAWAEYQIYGGMPELLNRPNREDRRDYLTELTRTVYVNDIIERYHIELKDELDSILDVLSSSVGSLTNPSKLTNTLKTVKHSKVSVNTVDDYLRYISDAYLFEKSRRFNVKGRKYMDSPFKFYCMDVGLLNAWRNFEDPERPHLMENIIYLELRSRGFNIDIGFVEARPRVEGRQQYQQLEIDFIARRHDRRYYIQSAYAVPDRGKREQETRVFRSIGDGYKKVLVCGDLTESYYDSDGVLNVGIIEFLTDESLLGR